MDQNKKLTVGFAITGSFCTFEKILTVLRELVKKDWRIVPVFSERVLVTDNRFKKADEFVKSVRDITHETGMGSIVEAETIGPGNFLDVLVIAPCTGNTLAKLSNGITDSSVLMAAKAHLRNEKPLVISVSTNDALGMNFKNIGLLMNMKNIYFVPFGQDNYKYKHNSMIACTKLIPETIQAALDGRQLQPVIQAP